MCIRQRSHLKSIVVPKVNYLQHRYIYLKDDESDKDYAVYNNCADLKSGKPV